MMATVLAFTVVGSYLASLLPSATMGSFSVIMTFLLGIKFIVRPVMTTKEAMEKSRRKACDTVRYLRNDNRSHLRIRRCGRRHDDAAYSHHSARL